MLLAASTREKDGTDEAELILRAWHQAGRNNVLLIIVPRHPERFQAAYDCAQSLGFKVQKRSDDAVVQPETQVWIGDSMGELFAYYQAADIAFVGGSLVDTGCQNIIEPLICGKPVLFGQSVYNFQAACEQALSAGVAQKVTSAHELVQAALRQLDSPADYQTHAARAAAFVAQHRGASRRIADRIAQYMHAQQADKAA